MTNNNNRLLLVNNGIHFEGDYLTFDASQKELVEGKWYLISKSNSIAVAKVVIEDSKPILISSVNQATKVSPEEIEVIGRLTSIGLNRP